MTKIDKLHKQFHWVIFTSVLLIHLEAMTMAQVARNPRKSNDNVNLIPKVEFAEPSLKFDFPNLLIGIAEYEAGPTGCTVFYFTKGGMSAIDIRGGSPGTIMGGDGWADAICFAGGSVYGLEASTGVADEILAMRGYSTNWMKLGVVRGAVIYDFASRRNAIYPDTQLGRAAMKSAKPNVFPLGARGAGRSATVGKCLDYRMAEPSGQGGAFRQIGDTRIAVFTVVNAIGAIVNREGKVVRGNLDRDTGKRFHTIDDMEQQIENNGQPSSTKGNTTLTLVATNQKLSLHELKQLGRQVHCSMSRAIQPFHTMDDGDVLFAVTLNEVENRKLGVTALGMIASELAWDAVLTCFSDESLESK